MATWWLMFLVLFAATAQSKPIENYKWVEVRTENFVIRSLLGEGQTMRIARHLEMVKAVLPDNLQEFRRSKPTPEVIYFVKGVSQLNELGRDGGAWAYADFKGEKYMLIAADRYAEYPAARAYILYLVGSSEDERHGTWFRSGMDSFIRGARVKQGKFWFAGQQAKQPRSVDSFTEDVELLLSDVDYSQMSDGRRRELGQSAWLLVRLLTDQRQDWRAFGDNLGIYLAKIDEGADWSAAFEAAFGIPTEELGQRLSDFSRECCAQWVIGTEKLVENFDPVTTRIPKEKIAQYLAEIAAELGDEEKASELREIASGNDGA